MRREVTFVLLASRCVADGLPLCDDRTTPRSWMSGEFQVRRRMRVLALFIACALIAAQADAQPKIERLSDAEIQTAIAGACRFSSKAAGGVVALVAEGQATMRLDGKLVQFKVTEVQCTTDCVAPGRYGTRSFRLLADNARAGLSKRVFCHRDSEACSGLAEGPASLTVSTERGRARVALWHADCDP